MTLLLCLYLTEETRDISSLNEVNRFPLSGIWSRDLEAEVSLECLSNGDLNPGAKQWPPSIYHEFRDW